MFDPFFNEDALALNKARLDHLNSLFLPLLGRSVYEPGCGIGLLTGFWEARDCLVVSSDLKPENVAMNKTLHPWREDVVQADATERAVASADIVFCYGLLYHVKSPAALLHNLSLATRDLFILETCVHNEDNGELNPHQEWPGSADQGEGPLAYSPARDWVMAELSRLFPFVYCTVKQPNHPQFPTSWPVSPAALTRAVFVASRTDYDGLATLSEELPMEQERHGR